MPRKKQYFEEDVVEKAMNLFWIKGYESTSMQMLEKEMGINKFSIYSSFGSKNGLFIESMKLYRKKVNKITKEIEKSFSGVLAIKEYFYTFLRLSENKISSKGCLITNTLPELDIETDKKIVEQVEEFREDIKQFFFNSLILESNKNHKDAEEQADYLLISIIALSVASKVCNDSQLQNYMNNTFKRI